LHIRNDFFDMFRGGSFRSLI